MRLVLLVTALCLAFTAQANDEVRVVPAFTSISVQGPISVTVEGGTTQSMNIRGSDKFIQALTSQVVNGELRLRLPDKSFMTKAGDQRIIITMPQLRAFSAEGAGEIKLENMRGERLDVSYKGAGRMLITGKVDALKLKAEGVGEVNTKGLITHDADVDFRGIGEVQVYAKNKLDAVVRGMGSLTYFGKPQTVNKSVAGLGKVIAGD
ncbi:head GIN domain-containing protein [Massilia horti]|uniref:DUF2807 domain-containing protein n=1 Tax=Massilia horti TaxID=2562153 RepID=A0A4Y9T5W9_9BURK|nr:head GIN domain-containing protein [Massilia horti]TFW36157.1 DUF2807 domain-containing protein [Massilia horti]